MLRYEATCCAPQRQVAWGCAIFVLFCIAGCGSGPLPPPPTSPPELPVSPQTRPVTPNKRGEERRSQQAASKAPAGEQNVSNPPEATAVPTKPKAENAPTIPSPQQVRRNGQKVPGAEAAGQFIMSLCRDLEGNVWVGTEDHGILRRSINDEWMQFTQSDGLGDDNGYALCCDRLGRIWAGQLNHGVAVFNGESWANFDVLNGPLGERIFDIACSPIDGDVWIASSGGLSRYSEESKRWTYLTRSDGLPGDQASALAFDADGNLYVGTQCDGLAIGRRADNYAKWQVVSGEISETKYRQPQGTGLPSPLINDVLVGSDGTVFVATSLGLAKSKNQGQSWEYIRGRDYADKVKGRYEAPPKTWTPLPKEKLAALLPEDYVTCLAEDDAGRLWIGFRQQGFAVIDAKSGTSFHATKETAGLTDHYIAVLVPDPTGRALIGGYGSGLTTLKSPIPLPGVKPPQVPNAPTTASDQTITKVFPPHPVPAAAPTVQEMEAELAKLKSLNEPLPPVSAVFLGDDWKTQGDWVGRLGRGYTILCAMDAPLNDVVGCDLRYKVRGGVGPNGGAFGPPKEKRELLRHWVHRRRWDDPRVLYNPVIGYRRQADWDDHGEAYPMSHEGPDVWASVVVPEGLHRISLYFFNKDGHDGSNRYRSYLVEVKGDAPDPAKADRLPTLARARVDQFWGGVYKQFAVKGPGKYSVKIGCNDSFNTIVQAVMLDQLTGPTTPFSKLPILWMGDIFYIPPDQPAIPDDATPVLQTAMALKTTADSVLDFREGLVRHRTTWLRAYRAAKTSNGPPDLIANWNWNLRIWTPAERATFSETMARAFKRNLELNPNLLNIKDPDRPK